MKAEFSCGLYNNYGHSELGLNKDLFRIFLKNDVKLLTASDAHAPEDVGKNIRKANNALGGIA